MVDVAILACNHKVPMPPIEIYTVSCLCLRVALPRRAHYHCPEMLAVA